MVETIKAVMDTQALTEGEIRQLTHLAAEIVGDAELAQVYVGEENHLMHDSMDNIDSERSVGDNNLDHIDVSSLQRNKKSKDVINNLHINSKKTSKSDDAASIAKSWQGSGAYPGVDAWENIILNKGTKVWGGTPGQSNFYTTEEVMEKVGNDATMLNQGLQVSKGSYPQYRPGMTQYELTQDIVVGYSKAFANPQYGEGGLEQYFIPNNGNVLKPIKSIIMTNR